MAELVQELTGCTILEAEEALKKHNGNVVDAVEALVVVPKVKGNDYIPKPPKIDHGLTPLQEEMCRRGRDLQDKINEVFSVAHSKTRHEHPEEEHGAQNSLSLPVLTDLSQEKSVAVQQDIVLKSSQ